MSIPKSKGAILALMYTVGWWKRNESEAPKMALNFVADAFGESFEHVYQRHMHLFLILLSAKVLIYQVMNVFW